MQLTSFWWFYCKLWTYFTPFSSVSIVYFEQMLLRFLEYVWSFFDPIHEVVCFNELCKIHNYAKTFLNSVNHLQFNSISTKSRNCVNIHSFFLFKRRDVTGDNQKLFFWDKSRVYLGLYLMMCYFITAAIYSYQFC